MKKRILSLALALTMVGSIFTVAPMTVSAETETVSLLTEAFDDATLDGGITYEAPITIGETGKVLNNKWEVKDGKLLMTYPARTSYSEGHPFFDAGEDGAHNFIQNYPVTLKIPFSGVQQGDKLTFEFTAASASSDKTDLRAGFRWADFASVYTSNGDAVVLGKRDRSNDGYISGHSAGKIDYFGWIGKTQDKVNQAIDYTNGSTECLPVGGGMWDAAAAATVTMTIDTTTGAINIKYSRPQSSAVDVTTYAGADLAAAGGGYLQFKFFLNTFTVIQDSTNGKATDRAVTFDDIKITATRQKDAVVIPTTMPINNTMDVADTYGTKLESKVAAGRFTIADEPGVDGNKVLSINTEAYSGSEVSNARDTLGAVWFPWENLGADENLSISYRFKDPEKKHDIYWQHFGSIVNDLDKAWTAGNGETGDVLRSGRYDFDPGFLQGSNGQCTTLTYYGMTEDNKLSNNISATGPTQATVNKYIQNISDWIRVDIKIERATKKATITYTNEATDEVLATGDVYLINDLSSSGALYFKGGPSNNKKNTAESIYLDDVKISTWKALGVDSTNLTETDFDAKSDIELTFSDTVKSADLVKQAISITEIDGEERKAVDAGRISVTLDQSDSKKAIVKVDGGLKYGKKSYELKLAGGVITSAADVPMTGEYTKNFTTKLSASVFIAGEPTLSGTSTTVKITNPTTSDADTWVMLALYSSDNMLIGYAQSEQQVGDGETTADITLTATLNDGKTEADINSAQLLLWNNKTDIIPYHVPIKLK